LRQANKISDALEVQRQRFLENRSSLSTINVNIQTPKPVITVTETGFRQSLREAVSDSITLASDLVLFFARFLIMMAPVALFALLPSALMIRYLWRRAKRMRLAQALATPSPE
jgi:uncharacterized protein DUF4349